MGRQTDGALMPGELILDRDYARSAGCELTSNVIGDSARKVAKLQGKRRQIKNWVLDFTDGGTICFANERAGGVVRGRAARGIESWSSGPNRNETGRAESDGGAEICTEAVGEFTQRCANPSRQTRQSTAKSRSTIACADEHEKELRYIPPQALLHYTPEQKYWKTHRHLVQWKHAKRLLTVIAHDAW
jgi:hypothetical protein